MKISNLYKLKSHVERAALLQKEWEEQKRTLLALPSKLGFASIKDLKRALDLVSENKSSVSHGRHGVIRKKRTRVTPELKQRVKALIAEKNTGVQIAEKLSLSLATVQNIKSSLGLVKQRR